MVHKIRDRVADTSTTTGTGDFTVSGTAQTGFETLNDVLSATDTFDYLIAHQTLGEWEVGIGTYSGSHVFVRTTVKQSSNSDNAVNFSSGAKDVVIVNSADRIRNPRIPDGEGVHDDSGNEQLLFGKTASAVNEWKMTNAATGSGPVLAANGGDSNISPVVNPKGTGIVQVGGLISPPQGRLTLTTGTPVMKATASAQTTIYYAPYVGRIVPLYDGTRFHMYDIGGELSQATTDSTKSPAAVTTNSNYDLFVWNDSGTIRCTRGPAWSSSTSRGTGAGTTELERVNGIYLNKVAITNGPGAQRGTYVGTVRSNGSSQIDWIYGAVSVGGTEAKLFVWNMYNQVDIATSVGDSTDSWTYSSATWRSQNASDTMRVSFISGLALHAFTVTKNEIGTTTGSNCVVGVCLDATNTFSGTSIASATAITAMAKHEAAVEGFHFIQAVERLQAASGTGTFRGDSSLPDIYQTLLQFRMKM